MNLFSLALVIIVLVIVVAGVVYNILSESNEEKDVKVLQNESNNKTEDLEKQKNYLAATKINENG